MRFLPALLLVVSCSTNEVPASFDNPSPEDAGQGQGAIGLTAVDSEVTVVTGESATVAFALSQAPADANVSLQGLPLGVSAAPASLPDASSPFGHPTITITADADAPHGTVSVVLLAQADGLADATAPVLLHVVGPNGALDPAFGNGGLVPWRTVDSSSSPAAIARAGATMIVAANTTGGPLLASVADDGTRDPAFGQGGVVRLSVTGYDTVEALTVAEDGRIALSADSVIGGGGDIGTSTAPAGIATFAPNGDATGTFTTQSVAPLAWDGASLLAGRGGALDSFVGSVGTSSTLSGLAPLALAPGNGGAWFVSSSNRTRRLLPNSAGRFDLDPSFDVPTGALALAPDPGGGVVALEDSLVRIDAAGALDPTFGTGGVVALGVGMPVALVPTASGQSFVVVGHATIANTATGWVALARYDHTGAFDTSFGDHGISTLKINGLANITPIGAALDASGRLWVLLDEGTAGEPQIARFRLDP